MGGDPRHVLTMCGILMFAAAAAVFTVRATNRDGLPLGASARP
jgi:maltose/moltooligosaccharide transporter